MADEALLWRRDPKNPGVHNMRPVLKSDYTAALEQALVEATGDSSAPQAVLDGVQLAYENVT